MSRLRSLSAVLALAGATACSAVGPDTTSEERTLQAIRTAFAGFNSLKEANAAGYTVWSPDPATGVCPSSADGKMGYHLVNVPLRGAASDPAAGDATIDPMRPEMLLYEKAADGSLRLAGVEYIVFKAAWEAKRGAGAAPPEVLGQPLLASSHSFVANGPNIEHYELHVWLWKDNPNGLFKPWNPNVTC